MAFDPTKPVNNAPVLAAELRAQFNGLNDAIALRATSAALASAVDGTSSNTNHVGPLAYAVSDPPTAADVQIIVSKIDELITALRR